MVTTTFVEDGAAIIETEAPAFEWGAVVAGALVAAATTFFLVLVGAALGLSLAGTRNAMGAHPFLTIGAIYFLAAQGFGFALGGYVTGRLMLPALETEDEQFRADIHGLAVWSLTIIAGLAFVALAATAGLAKSSTPATTPMAYWSDKLMTGAPANTYTLRNDQISRLLTIDAARVADQPNNDRGQLIALVASQNDITTSDAAGRVENVENQIRAEADIARKAALYLVLGTVFALLFGGFIAVTATVMARFQSHDFHPLRRKA